MAYSRFSNSTWYTFWFASEMEFKLPTKKLKNQQVFEICDCPSYYVTYEELKTKDWRTIIKEIKRYYKRPHQGQIFVDFDIDGEAVYKPHTYLAKNPTAQELNELVEYFKAFVEDVDDHFKFWNFIKYEWYYPIRNKVIFYVNRKFSKRNTNQSSKF
jgi:hypothetical protein